MNEINISLYQGVKDTTGIATPTNKLWETLRHPGASLVATFETIRKTTDKAKRNKLKQQLPAVTWSGLFTNRAKNALIKHSGLICMDIDNVPDNDMESLRVKLCSLPTCYSLFESPSGNGLKVIFKIDIDTTQPVSKIAATHEQYFRMIADLIKEATGYQADESGKDVSRLCFLSYDPWLYLNPDAQTVTSSFAYDRDTTQQKAEIIAKHKAGKKNTVVIAEKDDFFDDAVALYKAEGTLTVSLLQRRFKLGYNRAGRLFDQLTASGEITVNPTSTTTAPDKFSRLRTFTNKIKVYEPGSFNDYVNTFVMNCKQHGIPENETQTYCLGAFTDYEEKLLLPIIKSVYGNASIPFGKYTAVYDGTAKAKPQSQNRPAQAQASESDPRYNETIKFYYQGDKLDKRGEKVIDQNTGEVVQEVKFDHDKITYFLANNGFRKLRVGDNFRFIRIKNNQVEPVTCDDITHFLLEYLSHLVKEEDNGTFTAITDPLYEVRKMFKRGLKTYTSETSYAALPPFYPNWRRDTEHTAYLYFQNCFVEVNKTGLTAKPYDQLEGHIWKKQMIERPFSILPDDDNEPEAEFDTFLKLAILGNNPPDDDITRQKYQAAVSGIGYLLHRYKDSTRAKAVVTADKKIRHTGNESNGGSGKSLYFKAISKVVYSCIINGKSFKFDSQYPFGTLNVDHGLVVFNDVKKAFDFEELFHYITEDWDFRRLYENSIVMPFEESPKIAVATNFTLKGSGDSFLRRQHIIEFSNYFNATNDPIKHFGHRFFNDWSAEEWNRFYNFMLTALQFYLNRGLVEYPLENYGINKLIDTMNGEEGINWFDDNLASTDPMANFRLGEKWNRAEIFSKFKADNPQFHKLEKSNTFTGWVKEWALLNGLEINAHCPKDGIDKSGGTYYWTITKIEKK